MNKRLAIILSTSYSILLLPLIAMLFSEEVVWDIFDFLVAGILLTTTALLVEIVLRNVISPRNRFIVLGIAFGSLILVWAELAVGIFGSPIAGN
jgi:hypothetical protein